MSSLACLGPSLLFDISKAFGYGANPAEMLVSRVKGASDSFLRVGNSVLA